MAIATHPRAALGAPIVCALTATGVLVAASQRPLPGIAVVLAGVTVLVALTRVGLNLLATTKLLAASRREALTDPLTGLGNRRKLLADLEGEIEAARDGSPRLLALFDLNGFKTYNDTFGHPAGDALLTRLGAKLAEAVATVGEAYRMGGDEFCVLLRRPDADLHRIAEALHESGVGFVVSSAFGAALIPAEATTVSTALSLADGRLYAHKKSPSGKLRLAAG
jgi:two-component system, cell cycle response regulator